MSEIIIREAWFDDITGIREVAKASRQVAYVETGLIPAEENIAEFERLWHPRALKGIISNLSTKTLVAVRDDKAIGILSGRISLNENGHVRLHRLYVHPQYWGQSVGKQLWQQYWDAIPTDAKAIELSVLQGNQRAIEFYERLGFVANEEKLIEMNWGNRAILEMQLSLIRDS